MSDFKGFGKKRNVTVLPLHGTTKEDFDRCMAGYRRQGLSNEDAMFMVSVSNLYMEAQEIGLTPGKDVMYDPRAHDGDGGILVSPEMAEHMKGQVPEGWWDYAEAEGMLSKEKDPVIEADGETWLSPRCACETLLEWAREPETTDDGGEKTRLTCLYLLQRGGMDAVQALRTLENWIKGDDTLLAELLSPMVAGVNAEAKEQQENN